MVSIIKQVKNITPFQFQKLLYLLVLLSISLSANLQSINPYDREVDSLKQVVNNARHDTVVVNAWFAWDNLIYISDPELDLALNQRIDSLCAENLTGELSEKERAKFLKSRASALNNIGIVFQDRGDFAKAIDFYNRSLDIKKEIGNKKGIAISLNNIGGIYSDQGNYAKAVDYLNQSLKLDAEIGDKYGMANTLNNLGNIYQSQDNNTKAIEFYSRSAEIANEIGYKTGLAASLGNIGNIYFYQLNYTDAIDYYNRSLKISEEIGDQSGMAISLICLGGIYKAQGNFTTAFDYYNQSLEISEEIGNKQSLSTSLNGISSVYEHEGSYKKAMQASKRSLRIAQEVGAVNEIRDAALSLWKVYQDLSDYKRSLEMYELYIETRDSIISEENQKEVIRYEFKSEYEKQAATDSVRHAEEQKVKDAELTAQKLENKRQIEQQYYLYGGLGLVCLFGIFMFNRFQVTRRQKKTIEEKKQEVEQAHLQLAVHHQEIQDSINYAQRIQEAIMPPIAAMNSTLRNGFVLYLPKDVIAGDFFWMEKVNDVVYFAAADCTGHGVPGAMVSVVCSNALTKSLLEEGVRETGKLLDRTRELVIDRLARGGEKVNDGMDISLGAIHVETAKLQWSGANNPLWIVRNGEVLEIKADKQPIGKYENPNPFTSHNIELQVHDTLYVFTDGYQDQFGGPKGKKFKPSNLRKLLLSIQDEPMENQKTLLENAFLSWRGELEQVDDVCIIGVRI